MPDRQRLIELVNRFPGRRIAVLGDLVVDEFVYGDIARVSREAPVLILEHRRTVVVPGGGANAVANLRALDAEPLPVGVVGRDDAGNALLELLAGLGIRTSSLLAEKSHRTPTKSRLIAGGVHTRRQQIVRLDRGAARGELRRAIRERLARKLGATLKRADALLVADYGYGAATSELVQQVRSGDSELTVVVDSRARVLDFRSVTACTPNQEELENALGLDPLGDRDDGLESAGKELRRRAGTRAVLVTRGARGMCLFEHRRPPRAIPAFGSEEIADVTGAGDTVTAVFCLALAAGATFHEAAVLANYAAGLVVMKAGTATISRRELVAAVRRDG